MTLSEEEYQWFFSRAPKCQCGTLMTLVELGAPTLDRKYYYTCYQCNKRVKLLAANADLKTLSQRDKNRIAYIYDP